MTDIETIDAIEAREDSIGAIFGPVMRLSSDLKEAAVTLSDDEARFLVDTYYMMQKNRIRAAHQNRALDKQGEPHKVLSWVAAQNEILEDQIKAALHRYADNHPVGRWMMKITGIGPVIAAGLLAHIDITKAPTVGHIWRFAGLDPTQKWDKGEKRPWNATLKTLCWKVGRSFLFVSNNPNDIYGKVYKARKELEKERNDSGAFRDQALYTFENTKWKKKDSVTKAAYQKGVLPDGRIDLRARRYAVKLFLSHLHHVWYYHEFGEPPPKPFVIEHLGHAHYIKPPYFDEADFVRE